MKKLSILFISFLTVISAFLTSCDEDHYGPAPVDVTANYSNKISNPNPNLVLTYNGDAMNGKSVDFIQYCYRRNCYHYSLRYSSGRKGNKDYIHSPFRRYRRILFFR